MSTYRDVRKALVDARADEPIAVMMACLYCGEQATHATLSALGARCSPCYAQFQRSGYSGSQPPRQAKQASWVPAVAERCRRVYEARGLGGNAFVELAQQFQAATTEHEAIKGLGDDAVNALLQEVAQ